ncbi:MAG: hypothetical protein IJT49_04865 [Clostridia bacterium]|nr:hypothetical protein [Clostridia bacterium]
MRGDKLYRGIGDADEKYIKSAEKAFKDGANREKRVKAGRIFKRIVSVAAAVVIIGGVWIVSFIVAQKRQEPDHPASTGEPVTDDSETYSPDKTNDEPSTEADTTFILNPSDTEPVNVDPESECGKMIQSFDEYLKAKERGKYGDYYVSYCVKVNGAYIGFINDGETDYTEALENEVIDGLPFCYGNGQKLTVINGGEYRYGLAEAFNDGLLNSDKLDQFFVRYSSDQYILYKEFESEYLRQSCEEFLDGENERNIKEKPEKDKELSLYNYISIPYCKMLGDYKYAVLYLLWHQPAEECTDEYYTVSVGGYDFPVRTGLRFHIYDQGDVYPLDRAQLTAEELKALYDSYTKYEEPKTPDTTETPFTDVEFEWLDFKNTDRITNAEKAKELSGVFDEYLRGEQNPGIDFCVKLGNGKYAALLNRHIAQICIESTENVGGYPIHYSNYRKMTVLSGDTAYFGLQNAYEHDVLTYDDAYEIFKSYRDAFSDMYKDESFYSLLTLCFEEYLNGNVYAFTGHENEGKLTYYNFIDIKFCTKLPGGKYAVIYKAEDDTADSTPSTVTEKVQGFEFIYNDGNIIKVFNGSGFTSLSNAELSFDELQNVYLYYNGFYNTYYDKARIIKILFDSFINTGTSHENNIYYAYKTSDGVYIGILAYGDLMEWEETVAGYTFDHPNGNKFLIIKNDILTEGLKEAYESGIISAENVKEFYKNLQKFYEEQNKNIEHSGYETTVYMIRANWDGHGVSTKTVSTCDLAYSIIDALGDLRKTGEIADKTSDIPDDPVDSHSEYIFPEAERGMLWLQVGSKLYRVSSDLSEIAIVDSYFGKGYVLTMTDGLKTLLNNAWYYFPYDTYSATYDNAENKTVINHVYTAESTVKIDVKQINIEKSVEPNNSITLDVTSSFDQYVTISLTCYQSDDNLAAGDYRGIQLNANETKQITLNFGGWKDFMYWVDITADNTRVSLTIKP